MIIRFLFFIIIWLVLFLWRGAKALLLLCFCKKSGKLLLHGCASVTTFIVVCVVALLVWVETGPRSIHYLTPYIQSSLAPPDARYKITVEDSQIAWEGYEHPIALTAKNVTVYNDKGAVISYFPQIGLSIYFYKLFLGKIEVKSVELVKPELTLLQAADGTFSLGLDTPLNNDLSTTAQCNKNDNIQSIIALLTTQDSDNPITNLKSIRLKHANVQVKDSTNNVFLSSSDASLDITRSRNTIHANLALPFSYQDKAGSLYANINLLPGKQMVEAEVVYHNIDTALLAQLMPSQALLKNIRLPLSGTLKTSADFDMKFKQLDFSLESGTGTVEYKPVFPEPLTIENMKMMGNVSEEGKKLTIQQGNITFLGGETRRFEVKLAATIEKIGEEYALSGHAATQNIYVSELKKYWPTNLSPQSRKWVTTNILSGIGTKGDVDFNFKAGELKLKDTPDDAIHAVVMMKNGTVRYKSNHPPIKDISATLKFTGKTIEADIDHATYLNETVVNHAVLKMPDLYPDDVRMLVDTQVQSSAGDTVAFLSLPGLDMSEKLHLTPDIKGSVEGNIHLDFIAFSLNPKKETGDIKYQLKGKINDISQKGFLGKRDIEHATMTVEMDNKGLKANGKVVVNTIPMELGVTTGFDSEHTTSYMINTQMDVKDLPRLELPRLDFAQGIMGIQAKINESEKQEKVEAELDITDNSLAFPEHHFTKKAGVPATITFRSEKLPDGTIRVHSFALQGKGMAFSGNADYSPNEKAFVNVIADKVLYEKNNLDALEYSRQNNVIHFYARGASLDLSPYLERNQQKQDVAFAVDIKAENIVLGEDRSLKNATITADCADMCRAANIHAGLKTKGNINYQIRDGSVTASSDNAGEVLRTLGTLRYVEGGKLQLNGKYTGNQIAGELVITDYSLKNAPVFTKILTLASLTGIIDSVAGNGITFSSLHAPFQYGKGIILVKDAKTHGSALGLTASGTFDLNTEKEDINGVIVPSYTMNALVGQIPIIGDILLGGKGKGIIGINYAIKGDMNDPSISVNPLSVLTPGFLRGVFDVFDKPAPDFDKILADKQKEEAKKRDDSLPSVDLLKN